MLNVVLSRVIIQFIMNINDNVSILLVLGAIYTVQITIYNMVSVMTCEAIVESLMFSRLRVILSQHIVIVYFAIIFDIDIHGSKQSKTSIPSINE